MKTFVKTVLTSALILGGAGAAQAEPDLSLIFENTVVLKANMGGREVVSHYHYNPDGTVMIHAGENMSEGTWAINGDQMCTTMTGHNGQARDMCNSVSDFENGAVGDTWEFSPAEGMVFQGELVAGREGH